MKVLTANSEQYNELNNYEKNSSKLRFEEDANGKWIVGKHVINDPNFAAIKSQLQQLDEIDYEPKVYEIE